MQNRCIEQRPHHAAFSVHGLKGGGAVSYTFAADARPKGTARLKPATNRNSMRITTSTWIRILLFWTLGMGAAWANVSQDGAPVRVLKAEFGLFSNTGGPVFVPSKTVPLKPGQSFGWILLVDTEKTAVSLREEFTLPLQPATWGDPPPTGIRVISDDGRTAISVQESAPDKGVLFNVWEIAPGDPAGRHTIRVFIDGVLAGAFEFDVE